MHQIQIANGNFMPNVIPITESHQQEFIVNLTEDGQQQLSESEQPQTIMHPEVTFHNITGKVTTNCRFLLIAYFFFSPIVYCSYFKCIFAHLF